MKLLIKLSIATLVLLFVAIALLLILVNPNDYKTQIETQVKQSINRDLHIKGDLAWQFYPQLGFSSGEIELDNLAGFNKPHLIKIKQASLGINILPLLQGQISLAKLTIDGFELTLITDKNGLTNLDNMGSETASTAPFTMQSTETSTSQSNALFDISKTQLAGIEINNSVIEVQDLQEDSYQKVSINKIQLGQFAFNKETALSVNTKLIIDDLQAQLTLTALILVSNELNSIKLKQLVVNTQLTSDALVNGELHSTLKTDISYALDNKKITIEGLDINTQVSGDNLPNKKLSSQLNADIIYQLTDRKVTINNLKLLVDKLELSGEMSVQSGNITKVRYNLVANNWDLNPYMASTETETTTHTEVEKIDTTATTESNSPAEVEPDLSFLKSLDIEGYLKIAGLNIEKIKIGEINNHLIINKGKAQLKPLTAQLYQGLLTVNASVDESNGLNKYQLATKLNNVQLLPLLKDVADLALLSGKTSFNFTGSGQGFTATKIEQGIVGKGDFSLLDGEIYGINISQEIRSIKAALKGEDAPTNAEIKKTDFASLTGNFSIDSGLVNNQKLVMISPVMRLDGAGLVNVIKQTVDYKLSISPLSKTDAKTDYSDLSGITIPLLITGSFNEPSFTIDTKGVLKEQLKAQFDDKKEKLKKKAEQALEKQIEKLGDDTVENLLKSFF